MKLAITGGVAEGKSTVASYIRDLGIQVASADVMAREVFESSDIQSELSSLFQIALPVAPESVRERTFRDPEDRRRLNRLMHPRIWQKMNASEAPVIEVPLLFETALHGFFERVWVVTCGPEEQLRRLILRLGDESSARIQWNAQLKTSIKCAFADRIIRTIEAPDTVRSNVSEAIRRDL